MTSAPTSCVIYARLSADRTGDAASVDRQLEDCRKRAAEEGWTVRDEYVDRGRSAMTGRRPEYERMLGELDGVGVLLVWASDRLYRRLSDLERLVDRLGGTRVVALHSGEVDLGSADGRSVARILGALAQRESEKTGERVRAAARQRALQGRHHGGPRLYGFEKDGTPRQSELAELRGALARLDAGESLAAVCRDLGLGRNSIKLKRWLLNPRLVGRRKYRGEVVPGTGEALVDVGQWQRVAARFAATGRGRPPTTLLSGLARCGICGGPMRGNLRMRNGEKELAYRCFDKGCVSRKRDTLDSAVADAVRMRLEAEGPRLAAAAEGADRAEPEPGAEEALREELAALGRLVADGSLSAVAYAAAVGPVEARLADLGRARADAVGASPATRGLLAAGDVRGAWEQAGAGARREVVKLLVQAVVVGRGRGLQGVEIQWRNAQP